MNNNSGDKTPPIITATDNLLLRLIDKLEKQRIELEKKLLLIKLQLDGIQKEVTLSEEETSDDEEAMETSSDDEIQEPPKKIQKN